MKYSNVLVVGGSGFIGRHLVASLAAAGLRVTVPSRRRERATHLLLLPTADVVEAENIAARARGPPGPAAGGWGAAAMAPAGLGRLCAGKQAVYNLVGILHSRRGRRAERGVNEYGPDFARMHVEPPPALLPARRPSGGAR